MSELNERVRREIGQHFVFGFHGQEISTDIIELIRDYHIGNVILMKRNVQTVQQVHTLVYSLQKLAKESGHITPLLIGIDQENGLVSAFSSTEGDQAGTQFPGAMAVAASGSPELAERTSAASGRELYLAGVNWAYSPVGDINSDPLNPVIGVRSFGDDPHEVVKYVRAVSRGLASAGVAPCAKHFPGHGDTHVDSHLALPRILKGKEALYDTELVPFQALVKGDIASIMTGHMALPLVTGDDTPSSLSKAITTDLLREELGYEGVVVTDCLEMEAVATQYGSEQGAVLSLEAGADIVMICHRIDRQLGAVEAAYEAVRDGRLSMDALKKSGTRVKELKDKFVGTWDDVLQTNGQLDSSIIHRLKVENAELSHRAYAASIALLSDPRHTIPLPREGTAIVLTPQVESINFAVDDSDGVLRDRSGRVRNTAGPSYLAFAQSISSRIPTQHFVYSPGGELPAKLDSASSVVFATRNAHTSVWQIDYLRRVLQTSTSFRIVLVATCAPYDFMSVDDFDDLPRIATFEFTVPALQAAAAVIFGEQQAGGKVPVSTNK